MTWVDWIIVVVLAVSVLVGLKRGFFRSAFSLLGLILGLAFAAWNYSYMATWIEPAIRSRTAAEALAFLLIALLVTIIFSILGHMLAKALHWMGLKWLDHLVGAGFGFLQGALLVVILILVMVAFFPTLNDLTDAKLAKPFLSACRVSTHLGPAGLEDRVKRGLQKLAKETPKWLHPSV